MDQIGPAAPWNPWALLLDDQELMLALLHLAHLPPMSIDVEAELANGHLSLVRDMGSDPGDELLIIHLLQLFGLIPIN